MQEANVREQSELLGRLLGEQGRLEEEALRFAVQRDADLVKIKEAATLLQDRLNRAKGPACRCLHLPPTLVRLKRWRRGVGRASGRRRRSRPTSSTSNSRWTRSGRSSIDNGSSLPSRIRSQSGT